MRKIISKLTLVTILLGTLVAGFLGLIVYNMKDMVFGANFTVIAAADGSTVDSTYIPITGTAKHAKQMTINGRIVSIDRQGNFSDGVILSPGYNIVEVAQRDQFGKEKKQVYHWVASPSATVAQNDTSPYQR
jgi:hypothetical protein